MTEKLKKNKIEKHPVYGCFQRNIKKRPEKARKMLTSWFDYGTLTKLSFEAAAKRKSGYGENKKLLRKLKKVLDKTP